MATSPWENRATDTGSVKEVTLVSKDVLRCWCSIADHCDASFHQLKIVTYPRHRNLHQQKKTANRTCLRTFLRAGISVTCPTAPYPFPWRTDLGIERALCIFNLRLEIFFLLFRVSGNKSNLFLFVTIAYFIPYNFLSLCTFCCRRNDAN